ncbi:MAG TPA: hypothetical protein VFS75_01255 [Candidatus Paceibacterota bacterium]|nr:hypothetical protein [Candidatus Paceibacterota bacterium]
MIHLFEESSEFLEKFGLPSKYALLGIGFALAAIAYGYFDLESSRVYEFMVNTAPIWAPIITFFLFFEKWLEYVRLKFNVKRPRVTLEIKLPQEVLKSPEAMELVLNQLHQGATPDNHIETYVDGKHPPKFGLEIVSRGGDVRFYINVQKPKFKNITETQLYAQYPGIEVHELDIDYTAEIPWDPERFKYFSIHFGHKKPTGFPIKTYVDYELQEMPKEEEKIDPITSMLEMLGSIGPGEYVWVQMLIEANRKVTFKEGALVEKPDWTKEGRAQVEGVIKDAAKRVGVQEDEIGRNVNQFLTDEEKETIRAMERGLSKNAFNTAIRCMYIAESDAYNPGERIGAIITGWRSYDYIGRNAIGVRWRTDFDWNWWQDPSGHEREHLKHNELEEYKKRTYTNYSHADLPTPFSVEELATMYHFPGTVASTPSLARLPSKRSEAPSNLPT